MERLLEAQVRITKTNDSKAGADKNRLLRNMIGSDKLNSLCELQIKIAK
jgi:hypothetical protein